MGLRHVRNRVFQVVVDVPAAGVSTVAHTFTNDARSARKAAILAHTDAKSTARFRRHVVMAEAINAYRTEMAIKRTQRIAEIQQQTEAQTQKRIEIKRNWVTQLNAEISEDQANLRARTHLGGSKGAGEPAPPATKAAKSGKA